MEIADKIKTKFGQKGVGPIGIIVIVVIVALLLESVYVNSFIADVEVIKRAAQETAIVKAIDTVEFAKRALDHAVPFSFYEASNDVLETGGYCSFDSDACTEECKVPNNVPTNDCDPFWRVYDNSYAMKFGTPSTPEPGTFAYYLSSRISAVYDDYTRQSFDPKYCPMPPGEVTMEDMGGFSVRVNINNIESGVVAQIEENVGVVEHNTQFNDMVGASTLRLFEFARDEFLDNDRIGSVFESADGVMENIWCVMDEGSKDMYFGDVCGSDVDEFCESQLTTYCSKASAGDPCDIDNDGILSAEEKYRCTVQGNIEAPIYNDDGTIEASGSIDGCFNVDHSSNIRYSNAITVHWQTGDPGDCDEVSGCECDIPCIGNEENCGDCAGETVGIVDSCPWAEKICSPECCVDKLVCTARTTSGSCTGTNTANCDPQSSEFQIACCEGGECDSSCNCDDCDLIGICNAIGCSPIGPWLPECCNGPGDPKDLVCDSCCGQECTQKRCEDISGGASGCEDCGCTYIEGETTYEITPNSCNANVCELPCCIQTETLYENAACDYDYFGTTTVDVEVKDTLMEYPIGSSWEDLALNFKVVSGNATVCDGNVPIEESDYVADGSVCCPALTTNAADEAADCKSEEVIEFYELPEGGVGDGGGEGPVPPPEEEPPSTPSSSGCDSQCQLQSFGSGTCKGESIGENLLFSSGFEQGVYLDSPVPAGDHWVQYIRGEDYDDNDWTEDFPSAWREGNKFQYYGVSQIGNYLDDCVETRIDSIDGTSALYMELRDTDGGMDGQARNQYDMDLGEGVLEEAYVTYRIKLQPNLEDVMGRGNWRIIMEWFEGGPGDTSVDYRWNIHISSDSDGELQWEMPAQLYENDAYVPQWREISDKVSPESIAGEWALVEVYWKHSTASDGLIWFAINGEEVLRHTGKNMHDSELTKWSMFKIYAYPPAVDPISGIHYQWIDDFKIYGGVSSNTNAAQCLPVETSIGQDGCGAGFSCCCSRMR
jgi:hypothetical protein